MFQAVGTVSAKSRKWKYAWIFQGTGRRPDWLKCSRERIVEEELEEVG